MTMDPAEIERRRAAGLPDYGTLFDPAAIIGRPPEFSPGGIAKLAAALAAAQGKMKPPAKSSVAEVTGDRGSYTYAYTTLAQIIEAARAPLAEAGIAHFDIVEAADPADPRLSNRGDKVLGLARVTIYLVHASGEWIRTRGELGFVVRNPQSYGAALAFLRRYLMLGILGLAAEDVEESDDGERSGPLEAHPEAAAFLLVKAQELFGADAEAQLKSYASRRGRIANGDWRQLNVQHLDRIIAGLTEKAEAGKADAEPAKGKTGKGAA